MTLCTLSKLNIRPGEFDRINSPSEGTAVKYLRNWHAVLDLSFPGLGGCFDLISSVWSEKWIRSLVSQTYQPCSHLSCTLTDETRIDFAGYLPGKAYYEVD